METEWQRRERKKQKKEEMFTIMSIIRCKRLGQKRANCTKSTINHP